MKQTLTIARRELASLFFSPIAYVVLVIFALGSAWLFQWRFQSGQPAEMRWTFDYVSYLLVFLVPAISMRLLSEEWSRGTIETLLTSPVSDTQVVLGKWLGALGFFAALLGPLVVMAGVLEVYGSPDYGPLATGFIGLILVGGFYLAIGVFASAVTRNQVIAFVLGVFLIGIFVLLAPSLQGVEWLSPGLTKTMNYLSVYEHLTDFTKGLLDSSHFVYFLSGMGLFLMLAVQMLGLRRWS
jgi:ABC-2 type transport system permease protein